MVATRVPFAQIQGYQPAVDYRKSGAIGVLSGRNFAFDASGVSAAYASRLVAGDTSLSANNDIAYQIRAGAGYHVGIGSEVWRFVPTFIGERTGTWENLVTLDNVQFVNNSNVPEYLRGFTSAFIADSAYVCSWNHGVYRYDTGLDTYVRLTDGTVTGFPADSEPVIAICETNGRLLLLTASTLYWSAPGAPENLVPSLGGAGFQTISQHISGAPRAITPVAEGAIVWTTHGSLACEFIGGDGVFRYYPIKADALPDSQNAITQMPEGRYAILTELGLYQLEGLRTPRQITPLFNEFIREYLRSRTGEVAYLWYTPTDKRVFVSFRATDGLFVETFALDLTLDKWGVYSEAHYGFFHYIAESSPFAVMDTQGVVSYFLPASDYRKDRENSFAPGTYRGLDSEVELGFVRAENIARIGDSLQEIHEVVLYKPGAADDVLVTKFDEGLVSAGETESIDEGLITDPITFRTDEGILLPLSPTGSYSLKVLSDLFTSDPRFGSQYYTADFQKVNDTPLADTWVGMLTSFYFRLELTAQDPGDYFRVNAVDCTIVSAGQQV